MELIVYWFGMLGKAALATLVCGIVYYVVVVYVLQDWLAYRKAKGEIFAFVESYKKRCTGNNRFVVTVESLQDSFREYDTKIIEKVWQQLVDARKIVVDPQDQEWCVR
jgi:hypothetical protein